MLAQPLQCDDSYEDCGKAEDEAEEPEDVHTNIREGRGKRGDGEALRDVRSICTTFKLGEDAQ